MCMGKWPNKPYLVRATPTLTSNFCFIRNKSCEQKPAAKRITTGKLANKVIVVIGGTTGLGFSAAKAFCEARARVVVVGRNPESVRQAEAALGNSAAGLRGDASEPSTALAAIQVALKTFGGFHGLYHVAGGSGRKMGDGPLHEISDEGWDFTLN